MAAQLREIAFRYFHGSFTYNNMEAFISAKGFTLDPVSLRYRNGGHELVGFAFYTKKTYSGADNLNFVTTNLEVSLVCIDIRAPQPSQFIFYPAVAVADGPSAVDLNFTPGQEIDFSSYIAAGNAGGTYNLLVNYNQSREFRLSFLDYEAYAMFRVKFASNPPTNTQGINYTRAAISMPILTGSSASAYTNYRTLKFSPNPEPTATGQLPDGVEDVAYRLGSPCPPVWYQSSTPSEPPNDGDEAGGGEAGLTPLMFSTSTVQQGGDPDKAICSCALNATDIDSAMVQQGIIKDEFSEPIKVGRYILIRLLIWGLIVVAAALLAWRGYDLVAGKAGLTE